MPTLELINERFARLLRLSLFGFLRRNPEIAQSPVRVVKYSEFIRNLAVPTNLNIMTMRAAARQHAVRVRAGPGVHHHRQPVRRRRALSHPRRGPRLHPHREQRIIQRMLSLVVADYEKSWKPVHEVQYRSTCAPEMHTQFASIATPSEVVVVSSFKIESSARAAERCTSASPTPPWSPSATCCTRRCRATISSRTGAGCAC